MINDCEQALINDFQTESIFSVLYDHEILTIIPFHCHKGSGAVIPFNTMMLLI